MAYSRKSRSTSRKRSSRTTRGSLRGKSVSRKARGKRVNQRSRRSSNQTVRLVIEQAPVAAPVVSAQEMLTPTQAQAARVRRF